MKGNPKYNVGDVVHFSVQMINQPKTIKSGVVFVVDAYGVWEDSSDVHYDILVDEEDMIYKHVKEDLILD